MEHGTHLRATSFKRPFHWYRRSRHERYRARPARAWLQGHRIRPQESHYVRELEAAGIDVRVGHEAPPSTRSSPTSWLSPRPFRRRTRSSSAPVSWAFPSGRAPRCSRRSRRTPPPSPLPARMARRPPPPCAPPCSTAWGSTRRSSSAASWRATTPTARTALASYFVAEADESDGSFLFLDPDVVGGHQHRGRPPRPLRHPREHREDLLRVHGPRGRGRHRDHLWRRPPLRGAGALYGPQGGYLRLQRGQRLRVQAPGRPRAPSRAILEVTLPAARRSP